MQTELKAYEKPDLDLIRFTVQDVLLASSTDAPPSYDNGGIVTPIDPFS